MKKNLTELVFILDCSGSMHGLEKDTIGGFNSMLQKQRALEGEAYVSTVLFSNSHRFLHDRLPMRSVEDIGEREYSVGGCTALLDAVGSTIKHVAGIHKYARSEDVPEHTMFVIITDGMENASKHYSADEVRRLIEHEKTKYGWEFIFLGANIDAVSTASRYGISEDRAVEYCCDAQGTALNYHAVSAAVEHVRGGRKLSREWKAAIERDHKSRG